MRSGKLGVVVLILAITCTLGVSWVMSMDVNEVEVTKYKELTDINSEFQTEKTPEYIVYNPSTNYTGYYTDDSIVNNVQYFDGVDYTSSTANNYRLNLKPTSSYDDTEDLSLLTGYHKGILNYLKSNDAAMMVTTPEMLTIPELLTQWNLTGYDSYVITNNQAIDWNDPTDTWVGFVYASLIGLDHGTFISIKNPSISQVTAPSYADWNWSNPIVSCKYDTITQTVELFYDADMTKSAGIFTPSTVYIMWGVAVQNTFYLGDSVDVEAYDFPEPEYMDPSKGVNL